MEHFVDLGVVLVVVVEHLTCQFQLPSLFVVSGANQHLKPCHLHLSQLKLLDVCQQNGLSFLQVGTYVIVVVYLLDSDGEWFS